MMSKDKKNSCCVPFCNSTRKDNISFHEFPSDFKIRTEWLQVFPLKDFIPLDYSKVCAYHFQKSDFVHSNRVKRLKKNAIPSIFEVCPTIITGKEKNDILKKVLNGGYNMKLLQKEKCYSNEANIIEKRSLFVIEKSKGNESQSKENAINISQEHSSKHSSDNATVELIQTSESEGSQTQSNVSSVPPKQVAEIKSSTNSVTSFLMNKNVSMFVFDKNKTTTPMKEAAQSVTNGCTSFNIENNYTGLLKRKADVNNCAVNKMLKISSTPKNEAVSFSKQSTCSSNESQSMHDTENGTASALSHQLVSQDLPSDGETVNTSDVDNKKVGGENKSNTEINLSNVPSNRFTGITKKRSNLAGTHMILSHSEARGLPKQTDLPQKYFDPNSYKYISELRHKHKNMISLLSKKNKKIRLLTAKLQEMSEKLEYFENHKVMKKVEKLLVINDKGLASIQVKFLLSQLSNLDKKTPRWPDDVVRECVLLHASAPKFYETLKSGFINLPCRSTLVNFASRSRTRSDCDLELESELVTEIANSEPEFENETVSRDISGDMEDDIAQYFNTSISDMF